MIVLKFLQITLYVSFSFAKQINSSETFIETYFNTVVARNRTVGKQVRLAEAVHKSGMYDKIEDTVASSSIESQVNAEKKFLENNLIILK